MSNTAGELIEGLQLLHEAMMTSRADATRAAIIGHLKFETLPVSEGADLAYNAWCGWEEAHPDWNTRLWQEDELSSVEVAVRLATDAKRFTDSLWAIANLRLRLDRMMPYRNKAISLMDITSISIAPEIRTQSDFAYNAWCGWEEAHPDWNTRLWQEDELSSLEIALRLIEAAETAVLNILVLLVGETFVELVSKTNSLFPLGEWD